jgi:hypothetical protein
MKFQHAITVRSQPGKNADYRRALERVAFFPGVTEANLVGKEAGSVTIGYNGKECAGTSRKFCADLEADGLMADGPFWGPRGKVEGCTESITIAVVRKQTRHGHFQSTAIVRAFDRRF